MITNIKILPARLAEVGKIKIGGKGEERTSKKGTKYRLPKKLDHFIITTNERNSRGDLVVDEKLMARLGEHPTELDIILLYDEIELNFPHFLAWYEGRKRKCYGDGEVAERIQEDGSKKQIQCPCELLDKGICKPTGILQVILKEAQQTGGVYVFRTHSWNSITNIRNSMALVQKITGGILAGIPFKMKLMPKTHEHEGGVNTNYIVNLVYDGPPLDLRKHALEIAETRANSFVEIKKMKALEAARIEELKDFEEPPEEVEEVVQEYYPHNQPGYKEDHPEVLEDEETGEKVNTETGEVIEAEQLTPEEADELFESAEKEVEKKFAPPARKPRKEPAKAAKPGKKVPSLF